jgi:fatty-acyl-CoA synthase
VLAGQDLAPRLQPLLASGALDQVIVASYSERLDRAFADDLPAELTAPAADLGQGFTLWRDMLAADRAPTPVAMAPLDLAVLPYTSGSTGRGKGCMHTHSSALHAVNSMHVWFDMRAEDVFLCAAPMFHVVGMQAGMNLPIAVGGTLVLLPRWNREVAARLIRQYHVSAWPTVPTAVIDFLNRPTLQSDDLQDLRVVWGGGMAMPEAIAEKLHRMTGLDFLEGYGLTETICPATACPPRKPKAQCGGVAAPNTDVVIADPDSNELLPVGTVGEILVAGPQVLRGYWQNPEATAESFVEIEGKRFLKTGDLGRLDDEGYVFIVDRLKRMINASGYKVWPSEVESILFRHPAIAEACVIGARDPYRGETVKAVVVLQPGATLDAAELHHWAAEHMAAYKAPRLLEVVDALPKSGAGKVLWRALQEAENARDATARQPANQGA